MQVQSFKKNKILSTLAIIVAPLLLVTNCDMVANQLHADRSSNYDIQDYRDALSPREIPTDAYEEDEGIPDFEAYVAPVAEDLKYMELVSVSLNETVPLRDAIFELAREVDYDIELDPRIRGSIIFTARNKPFDVVIRRISEIAGLRYSFEGDILRVELDTPYAKSYKINYLNLIRTTESDVEADISVVSGDGASTGSSYKVENKFETDFWTSLESTIQHIIESDQSNSYMKTDIDPVISVSETNRAPVTSIAPVSQSSLEDGFDEDSENNTQVVTPNAVLNVQALPTDVGSGAVSKANEIEYTPSYAINKQAGLVSVYSTQKVHKKIEEYINEVSKSATSQVLIEAKILEVTLTDKYKAGVDWDVVQRDFSGWGDFASFPGFQMQPFGRPSFLPAPDGGFRMNVVKDDIGVFVDALSQFGVVKALASPRVTVMNNQSAVLNVSKNLVYFEISIDVTTEDGQQQVEIESEIKSVPEGVLINVSPNINVDDGSIIMAVRPTVTNIDSYIRDPGLDFVRARSAIEEDISNLVPVVQVQEIDSIVKMRSKEVMVMGGLLRDRTKSDTSSVPVLGDIPFLGKAFTHQEDSISKTELVIFLKTTILDHDNGIHNTDKDLYKMFSSDRRPFKM